MRTTTLLLAGLWLALAGASAAQRAGPDASRRAAPDSAARDSALHLVQRITWGPRPGDVDRVLAMGVAAFLEQQLNPASIPDPQVAPALQHLAVLHRSTADLGRTFRADQAAQQRRQREGGDSAGMRPDRGPASRDIPATRRHVAELQQAVVVRAVLSERQLYEVLVDFWTNHFNVFIGKGPNRFLMRDHVEHTIRPRVLGRFEDLLLATARSPAMLVYLDNAQSVAEGATPPQLDRLRRNAAMVRAPMRRERLDSAMARLEARMPQGLNENYARELLELHTLGVDAGYTQEDVVQVARILTGWSLDRRDGVPAFAFQAWAHDRGTKRVLGQTYGPGGEDEGRALLAWLARHPSTARHLSAKLCARFVADEPPAGCIEAGVAAWERTDGDLREVVRAVLTSPEFWSPVARGAKIKTPLEFVVSAVRAVGGRPDQTLALAQVVRRLGQPLFFESAPTGYGERQERWVNSAALLERLNVAMALGSGRLPGVHGDLDAAVPLHAEPGATAQTAITVLLHERASDATRRVVTEQAAAASAPREARALAVGLVLGSPEFQRQ